MKKNVYKDNYARSKICKADTHLSRFSKMDFGLLFNVCCGCSHLRTWTVCKYTPKERSRPNLSLVQNDGSETLH
jgi:hypothetical protein